MTTTYSFLRRFVIFAIASSLAWANDINEMTDEEFEIMTTRSSRYSTNEDQEIFEYYIRAKIPNHFHENNVIYDIVGDC